MSEQRLKPETVERLEKVEARVGKLEHHTHYTCPDPTTSGVSDEPRYKRMPTPAPPDSSAWEKLDWKPSFLNSEVFVGDYRGRRLEVKHVPCRSHPWSCVVRGDGGHTVWNESAKTMFAAMQKAVEKVDESLLSPAPPSPLARKVEWRGRSPEDLSTTMVLHALYRCQHIVIYCNEHVVRTQPWWYEVQRLTDASTEEYIKVTGVVYKRYHETLLECMQDAVIRADQLAEERESKPAHDHSAVEWKRDGPITATYRGWGVKILGTGAILFEKCHWEITKGDHDYWHDIVGTVKEAKTAALDCIDKQEAEIAEAVQEHEAHDHSAVKWTERAPIVAEYRDWRIEMHLHGDDADYIRSKGSISTTGGNCELELAKRLALECIDRDERRWARKWRMLRGDEEDRTAVDSYIPPACQAGEDGHQ